MNIFCEPLVEARRAGNTIKIYIIIIIIIFFKNQIKDDMQ